MTMMTSQPRPIPKLKCNLPTPPGKGGGGGGALSPVGSPKTWCQSMDELSRSLQKICGSPSPGGSTELLHSSPSPPRTSPVPRAGGTGGGPHTPKTAPVNNGLSKSWGRGVQRTISHEQSLQWGVYLRPLMVRHEETKQKLEQMLTQICATQRENERSRSNSPGQEGGKHAGTRRESLKTGVKLRLALDENVLMEELVVSVDASSNVLSVSRLDRAGRVRDTLHTVTIPQATVLENVICSKTKKSLYIRECSAQHISLYFSDFAHKYLPIIAEDEATMRVKIVFHVPREITFDNLAVKTVDESVVVLGQRGRPPTLSESDVPSSASSSPSGGSAPEDGTTPASSSPFGPGDVTSPGEGTPAEGKSGMNMNMQCFRLRVAMPEGVDTRTVTAALSRANQLILCGAIDSQSRRYTC